MQQGVIPVSQRFQLGIRPLSNGLLLELSGPLGREEGEQILRAVQEPPSPPTRLVLNFTEARPINTAGLGGVLWAVRLVTKAGGQTSAYGLSDHMRKVFHVMGLTQYIQIAFDEAEALR
jgi:anti-anti-sigma regulatory factor